VRELENVLTRAAIVARGRTISEDHLHFPPVEMAPRAGAGVGEEALDAVIAAHLQSVLERTGGNRSEAARILEVSRSRLTRLMNQLGLDT
jgi:DNA-binding NtrC family response regulator